jgi:vanillate O-demethylase monooxygenase subunit
VTYLKDVWYCAALSSEIAGKPFGRIICEKPMVLFRTGSGRIAALEDRCAHRQAPLSIGQVVGEEIQCVYHGFVFDCDGVCTHVPRQEQVPLNARIEAYPAVERWGYVWVWLGPAERADPSTVPHLPWNADNNRRAVFFHWNVNANFQLMADNLLDVSHTDFLHSNSIGSRIEPKGGADEPKVELESRVEGRNVYFTRRVRNTLLGPVSTKWAGSSKPVDRSNTMMWEPPNTIHSILEFKNAETHHTIHLDHIMTPETPDTMHYFMGWTRDFGVDNTGYPTDQDVFREQTMVVKGEDIPMVEAQQANLRRFGAVRDIPTRQDRFITAVHRVLAELHRESSDAVPAELQRLV